MSVATLVEDYEELVPGLRVGGQLWQSGWPDDPGWFQAHGVGQAVNVVPSHQALAVYGGPPPYPAGLIVHHWPIDDTPADSYPTDDWLRCVSGQIIDCRKRGSVLVHCSAGNNRSTIAVCAALMRRRWPLRLTAAAALVRASRDVHPAPLWLTTLTLWVPGHP